MEEYISSSERSHCQTQTAIHIQTIVIMEENFACQKQLKAIYIQNVDSKQNTGGVLEMEEMINIQIMTEKNKDAKIFVK